MWFCKCDGGKETLAISQCLVNGTTQSCGCLREEFLTLGPMRAQMPKHRPQAVNVTYPIPENLHPNPLVNEVKRAMYQYRWERVEFEARQIERGTWKEPKKKPRPVFRDDHGKPIVPVDLKTLAEQWRKEHTPVPRGYDAPDVPASYNTGSSLADRVRVVTDEEWARLSRL